MKLSDAELEIMEKVWELGAPVTAAQLTERMAEKGWKPSTLLTFLARMVNKGALAVEKQGKQNLYRALVSAEDYRAQAARELLGRYAHKEIHTFHSRREADAWLAARFPQPGFPETK